MIKDIFISCIIFYRNYLRFLKLQTCRFYPTCSAYALECFKKYSIFKALLRSIIRILKCNPLHPGGYDPVK